MIKKHTHHVIKIILSFSLLVIVAGFLTIFFKPTITGYVVLNNNLTPNSKDSIIIYLFLVLIFVLVYALYFGKIKKK